MYRDIIRKLSIGFMDSISLENRKQLIEEGISVEEVLKMYPDENDRRNIVEEVLRWSEREGCNFWWYTDSNYPSFDAPASHLPYMLFVNGKIPQVSAKSISIVGTRNVDNTGFQASYRLGLECGANGICVVSGMADGCDQSAMNGCVDAGFCCYGVLGCGLDVDYPKYTSKLKKKVIESGGALISRFAPSELPFKRNFPNRNMIIAAMGSCTVVVQAPKKSGSLITADFALQLGKDVYVSDAGIGKNWNRLGSMNLANEGAPVIHSIDGITRCRKMAFEVEYASENTYRFGNKLYIFRDIRR